MKYKRVHEVRYPLIKNIFVNGDERVYTLEYDNVNLIMTVVASDLYSSQKYTIKLIIPFIEDLNPMWKIRFKQI